MQRQNPNSDDGKVIPTNKSSDLRVTIMCHIPARDIEEDEAPIEAIQKMDEMIKYLHDKFLLSNLEFGL